MRSIVFTLFILLYACVCRGQAYMPMPIDSASWRYRIYDIDYITQVIDMSMFVNGTDTAAHGHTYHKIFSRSCRQVGPNGFDPPVVSLEASYGDMYFGAMRDSSKYVYKMMDDGEKLMYNFNAGVGDTIPAYASYKTVTGIDSVLLGGVYHKRYFTTDPAYYVIEGVGSSLGLMPDFNEGIPSLIFFCFHHDSVVYTPDSTKECTEIYPLNHLLSVAAGENKAEVNVYPVPATDLLHIVLPGNTICKVSVFNGMGREMWRSNAGSRCAVAVSDWPRGMYYICIRNDDTGMTMKKIILE